LTSPFELPIWGTVRITEVSKEDLLKLWEEILADVQLNIRMGEKVVGITPAEQGYSVRTARDSYATRTVVLAMGRRGTPRKLDVPGEEQGKVMYRLIDAASYTDCDILIVGGGDSAVEAAVALSRKGGNRVTLSYRREAFSRIKQKNQAAVDEAIRRHQIEMLFNSSVREILPDVVLVQVQDVMQTIKNDVVFILAGGEMPFEFLRNAGIGFENQNT
jgi:thioredoxin reductase